MCPLAFVSYFWYKFYASLLAAQCFCSVSSNSVDFRVDSTQAIRGQLGQASV